MEGNTMAKNTKLDTFVREATEEDWEKAEREYNRIRTTGNTEEQKAAAAAFKEDYNFDFNSLYPYLKMREIMFAQRKTEQETDPINSTELDALKAENEELREQLKIKHNRKLKYKNMPGDAVKVQFYATKETADKFYGLIDAISSETGLMKSKAAALILDAAVRTFMPVKKSATKE